jgi:hypothetical protein
LRSAAAEGGWDTAARCPYQARLGVVACILILLLAVSVKGHAQSPTLIRTEPLALSPSKTTSLTLVGDRLTPGTILWTSFPATIEPAEKSDSLNYRISLEPDVPPGIGAIRVCNSNGVSNLQLILVDPLPALEGTGANTNVTTAQPCELETAVDGKCNELTTHFFRTKLRRHQRASVEVLANRIGSRLDPYLRVLDRSKRMLAEADDTPGCAADARIEFTAPAAGDYVIELRDTRYEGGPKHFYRLRVTQAAAASWRFLPLAPAVPGPESNPIPIEVELETSSASAINRKSQIANRQSATGSQRSAIPNTPPGVRATTGLTPGNGTNSYQPPVLLRGRFDFPGDRDVFRFNPEADDRWVFRGRTRSLGSPCDLYLRLEKSDGSLIAEADATGAGEGELTQRFKEPGPVQLVVEELNRGGGTGFDYEIEVVPFEPGFSLTVATNTLSVAPGETFELKVSATRQEFDGPITLLLAGTVEGFALTNNIIAEKAKETTMKVTTPATLNVGALLNFAITGVGQFGERQIEVRASTMSALKDQLPQMLYPPRELDGLIGLGRKPFQ